jgi:hypothetical protein
MGAAAVVLENKLKGLRLLERPAAPKFRTPWLSPDDRPPANAARQQTPREGSRTFASWSIDLPELGAEQFSMGSVLVALREKLGQGKSQLTLRPGVRATPTDEPFVERYTLEVAWKDNGCELRFLTS